MVLCFPTTDPRGMASRLSPHFGSAPWFTFIDTGSGRVEVQANPHARHEPGRCGPTAGLKERGVDAVVCRGLGQRAFARLREMGLAVWVTEAWIVSEAVEALKANAVRPMTDEEACAGGHGHGHGHGHDPQSQDL
jgi:predicted Fe-Mo cluster-binding NifX family protein